jgi:hypothetical protein
MLVEEGCPNPTNSLPTRLNTTDAKNRKLRTPKAVV